MKKSLILVLGILISIPSVSICQTQLAEVVRVWKRKNIEVKDGMVYEYLQWQNMDTARYYITGSDTFKVIVKFEKYKKDKPPEPIVTKIDGEQATFSSSPAWSYHGPAAANTPGWSSGTIAYSNVPGSWANYTFEGRQIKLFAESKPTHGTGVVIVKRGTQIIKSANVNFVSQDTILPVQIYDSGDLGMDIYTFELKVSNGYCLWDYVEITR